MYENTEHFDSVIQQCDSQQSFYESITSRGPQRFLPHQIKLTCPVHDNMHFKYFCPKTQNYLCHICVLDRNQGISPEWVDLAAGAKQIASNFDAKRHQFESMKKRVQTMKNTIKAGKHIDKFFDSLI